MRQNIEERWWSDPRRGKLAVRLAGHLKDTDLAFLLADGIVFNAWKLAERFWIPEKKAIPVEDWEAAGIPEEFITVKLAERRPDGVYVKGTKDACQWWFDNQAQKSEAGKRSAQRPRDELGRLLPVGAESPAAVGTNPTAAGEDDEEPPTPGGDSPNAAGESANEAQRPPTPPIEIQPSSSGSSSSSGSGSYKTPDRAVRASGHVKFRALDRGQNPAFDELYHQWPRERRVHRSRGDRALERTVTDAAGLARVSAAMKAYLERCKQQGRDPKYVMQWDTFCNTWQECCPPTEDEVDALAATPSIPVPAHAVPPERSIEELERDLGLCVDKDGFIARFLRGKIVELRRGRLSVVVGGG